jgi:hypothetical protein
LMRNSDLRKAPRARTSLFLLSALLAGSLLSGCGGGGGSSSGSGGTPGTIGNASLATLSGRVVDTAGNPVPGATVLVVGTSAAASTASDGSFTITNVPLTATKLSLSSPNTSSWYNYGTYNGHYYQFGSATGACDITLPTLVASSQATTQLVTSVALYPASNGSPPPPPLVGGCPP